MPKGVSFDKGPNIDGKGMSGPKETTPQNSVDGEAASKVPGGESKGGKHIEMTGPNKAK